MNGADAVIHVMVANGLDHVNVLVVNHVSERPSYRSHAVICPVQNGVSGQNGRNVRPLAEAEQLQEIATARVRENAVAMISKSELVIHQPVINCSRGQIGQNAVSHVVAREYRKDLKLAMTHHHRAMARMKKSVSVRLEFVLNGVNGPSTGPVTQFAEAVLPPEHVSAWESVSATDQSNLRNRAIIMSVRVGLIGLHGRPVPSHVEVLAFKIGHVLA